MSIVNLKMENIEFFPVLDLKNTTLQSFIDFWSRYYINTVNTLEKENEYYVSPISSVELEYDTLILLYKWKNGSILSKLKEKAFNEKIISRLDELNNLKSGGIKSIDDVQVICPDLSAIWLIFLTHIIDKESFPIFDMHVYRAYNYLKTGIVLEIPDKNEVKLKLYKDYLKYYNSLRPQIKDYKKWDEAMWAFGKFLSRYQLITQ